MFIVPSIISFPCNIHGDVSISFQILVMESLFLLVSPAKDLSVLLIFFFFSQRAKLWDIHKYLSFTSLVFHFLEFKPHPSPPPNMKTYKVYLWLTWTMLKAEICFSSSVDSFRLVWYYMVVITVFYPIVQSFSKVYSLANLTPPSCQHSNQHINILPSRK